MRIAVLAAILLCAAPALAQPPVVAIEDDVSVTNAAKCHGLRSAQMQHALRTAATPDARVRAAADAWSKYVSSLPNAKKVQAAAADLASQLLSYPTFGQPDASLAKAVGECEPFEIRN